MQYSFVAAALIAGAFAIPAPQETVTVDITTVDTITSCAATVTDCPARQHTSVIVSTTEVPKETDTCTDEISKASATGTWVPATSPVWTSSVATETGSWVSGSPSGSPSGVWSATGAESSPVWTATSGAPSGTGVWTASSGSPSGSPSGVWSATGAESSPVWTATGAESSPVWTASSEGPSGTAVWTSTEGWNTAPAQSSATGASWVKPSGTGSWSTGFKPSGTGKGKHPKPSGTGAAKPSGWATGTGASSAPTSTLAPYKGAANTLNAAGLLAGVGAVVAFFL